MLVNVSDFYINIKFHIFINTINIYMARIKRYSPFQNLSNFKVFIEDATINSRYFRINELSDIFTGGKNGFLIEGSPELRETTEVRIEILDVNGNPVYVQPGDGDPEYYEGLAKLVSVHVYDDTPIGVGKITILGELKEYVNDLGVTVPIPDEWRGAYNVRWQRDILINRNLNNENIVRFYYRPRVNILEFTKPVFNKTIPVVTQTGSVVGEPITPPSGIDIRDWSAGTLYKLTRTDGPTWTSSIDENTISIPSLNFSPTIIEVLNDDEVLVDLAYTGSDNRVTTFTTASYTASFQNNDGAVISDTTTVSSFGKIDITRLETFVGDVARVKIFRKSRNTAGDYLLVQEAKLESTELLKDVTVQTDVETLYGYFNQNNLDTYWVTSSAAHPVSINNSVLADSVKVDYDTGTGGVQTLTTVDSYSITEGLEYTVSFRTLLSGSIDTTKTLRAYLSSSTFTQDITNLSGSYIYASREQISTNIISENTGDAKLVFEFSGSDWYLSNASFRAASDTAFSPDEFSIVQNIPRKADAETFDFRFEFYDINNNYIPVDVFATKEFDGGNDIGGGPGGAGGGADFLLLQADKTVFNFGTGSVPVPLNQIITLNVSSNDTASAVTYTSAAFDEGGNYIVPGSYTGQYPGFLTDKTLRTAKLTVGNFTGSDGTYVVNSITYTASLGAFETYETIFKLKDGTDSKSLFATSNANQFIYEPTTLTPKPTGQTINVRAARKNLASLVTPITVNSGSATGNPPPLTYVGTSNGVDTYSITATQYSASNAAGTFPETTYSFTGSDAFGVEYSDEITISPVINFDGVSIILSNESTTFRANSIGLVSDYTQGDGQVEMRIGSNVIQHSEGLAVRNSFDITNIITSSNAVIVSESNPTSANYGITELSGSDSGSMILEITYLAGDNSTTVDFSKKVNYSKARTATPNTQVYLNPQTQNVTADSTLTTFGTPLDVQLIVRESAGVYSYNAAVANPSEFRITSVTGGTNKGDGSVTPNTPSSLSGISGSITFDYRNSESTLTTGQVVDFFVGVSSEGANAYSVYLTNESHIFSEDTSSVIDYTGGETEVRFYRGTTQYTYDQSSPYNANSYRTGSITPTNLSYTTTTVSSQLEITPTLVTSDAGGFSIEIIDNSNGLSFTKNYSYSKVLSGGTGPEGPSGSDGLPGNRAFAGLVYYQVSSSTQPTPTPTATSYTFSTATFSGLTSNWGTSPPIFSGSNQAKYWYSNFTADEDDPAGSDIATTGAGNLGFGAPRQAIGFSGLVTFTGPDSVSDGGTGTLSFGSSGTTTINGSRIVTGQIDSTNLSSTRGSRYDLDNEYIQIGGTSVGMTTGEGIWLDGGVAGAPDIMIGNPSANRFIRYDGSAGTIEIQANNFSVTTGGAMTATNAAITGNITANTLTATTAGSIGGWSIGSTSLANGLVTMSINDGGDAGLFINNAGGNEAVAVHDGTAFRTAALTGTPVTLSAGTTSVSTGTGAIFGQNTPATAGFTLNGTNSGTFTATVIGMETSEIGQLIDGTPTTLWLSVGSVTFIQTYHWLYLQVLNSAGTSVVAERMIASGYVNYDGSYETNITNLGTVSVILPQASYRVRISHKIGVNFKEAGAAATLLDADYGAGIVARYVNDVGAGRVVEMNQIGFKATHGYNDFILDTNPGASYFMTVEGNSKFEGPMEITNISASVIGVDNLSVGELSIRGGVLTINGDIRATGDIYALATSDERLKENLVQIQNPIETVKQITGYTFNWNNKSKKGISDKQELGFSAQQLQTILPQVVGDKGNGYLGVNYDKVVPLLVEAIKKQQEEIDELKNDIKKLKNE